ncbi:uncharacterized protein L3040_000256 [Drepanopeziza brunnea f. sp. 'multigermtubi']|uniref:uncharacterized protein n=1 Tax=Drepanopeziza brunnea f. sp. 'multigermtubi' TaxID=698441 RepID=UPI0023A327EB|nr:hypothetical protein L3040_000256 [Drepanopeziza brunnea f. sp. 'multigermtubi']
MNPLFSVSRYVIACNKRFSTLIVSLGLLVDIALRYATWGKHESGSSAPWSYYEEDTSRVLDLHCRQSLEKRRGPYEESSRREMLKEPCRSSRRSLVQYSLVGSSEPTDQ